VNELQGIWKSVVVH